MTTDTYYFSQTRLDSEEVGAFFHQLTDIEQAIARDYDYTDTPFAAGTIVPLDIQNKPWAQRYRYRWLRHIGQFKLIRNYTTDLPEVELQFGEREMPIYKWGQGYTIGEDDIAAVVRMGESLELEKTETVQQSAQQTLNRLIANGDVEADIAGFLDHPQALRSYAAFPLNGSATSEEKLSVLNDAANSPVILTKQQEKPDVLMMDLETYQHLTSDIIQIGTTALNKTVMQHFLETNPYIKEVAVVNEMHPDYLSEIGVERKRFIQTFRRDKRKVCAKVYQPLRWKDQRPIGIDAFYRAATFKYAGIHLPYPYSMHVIILPE